MLRGSDNEKPSNSSAENFYTPNNHNRHMQNIRNAIYTGDIRCSMLNMTLVYELNLLHI